MINIKIKNLEEVRAFLRTIPLGVKNIAGKAAADYLVGNEQHGLKHYPPYKHVSYKEAYGGFLSDKQRRYVMARIAEGTIDPGYSESNGYHRDAWHVTGEPPRYIIRNDVGYSGYLVGDDFTGGNQQSHMMKLKGWRTVGKNLSDNMTGAFRAAIMAVNKWMREHSKNQS
jgi:hypothetical protein